MRPRVKLHAVKATDKYRGLNIPLCTSLHVTMGNKNENVTFSRALHVPSDDQSMSTLAAARGAKTPNKQSGHAVDRIMDLWCFRGQN